MKNNGGSAFPELRWELTRGDGDNAGQYTEGGMTLRDYFAGQALAGCSLLGMHKSDEKYFAHKAYLIADAMLKEREKVKETDNE